MVARGGLATQAPHFQVPQGLQRVRGSGPAQGVPGEQRVQAEPPQQVTCTGKPWHSNCAAVAAVFIPGLMKPNPGVGMLHRDGVWRSWQWDRLAGWGTRCHRGGSGPAPRTGRSNTAPLPAPRYHRGSWGEACDPATSQIPRVHLNHHLSLQFIWLLQK